MIEVIRNLSFTELIQKLGLANDESINLEELDLQGFGEIRKRHNAQIAPLLVEDSDKIERVYVISPQPDAPDTVKINPQEMKNPERVPFAKPSGSQSPAIGPVIKRSFANNKPGPSRKVQETTLKSFKDLAKENTPWAPYFKEISEILSATVLILPDDQKIEIGEAPYPSVLAAAVDRIDERKTVFLTVSDAQDRWPGDRSEYLDYLSHVLAEEKYTTGEAPAKPHGNCSLCGALDTTVYPNGLKGAGINLSNVDRVGAFPGIDVTQAWKGYSLCLDCTDLIYMFKSHFLKHFIVTIAGEKALVLPDLLANRKMQQDFISDFHKYLEHASGDRLKSRESDLLDLMKDQDDAQLVLHIIWAEVGQNLENVCGMITDVLPSRLQALSLMNAQVNGWKHALAPQVILEDSKFDLELNAFKPLFKRPGGKKATSANESARLFELKRMLASAIYHGEAMQEKQQSVMWDELMTTARYYLDEIMASGNASGLLNEGFSEKKQAKFWTLAGWIRHVARFLHYLHQTEVISMGEGHFFQPQMESLKPFFESGSGIDSPEKAYTFLLGILYGKLISVQAAKGVNVGSNSLTWLKRLNLSGKDLPELYIKIREKLINYGTEGSKEVRDLIGEIGRIGVQLGDRIALNQVSTCYFLLLGQSMTNTILPTKE